MKKIILTSALLIFTAFFSKAQYYSQYFDGYDTAAYNSVLINIDADSNNIWQVGSPHKTIFHNASTIPNVIVTDTINTYPANNTSSFYFAVHPWTFWGIFALEWMQKLDMEKHHSGGILEYSVDTAQTWHNAFNDPHVYNFFGFQPSNTDTLLSGEYDFSGTDTNWRNVWLCFDFSWLSVNNPDSIYFRYTFKSDSVANNKEGWMIDNFFVHNTIMHPVKEAHKNDYMYVYPNPTKDILHIDIEKIQDFHIIEHMEVLNSEGKTIQTWDNVPTHFWFDTSKYAEGMYILNVKTNIKSEVIPFVVKKR